MLPPSLPPLPPLIGLCGYPGSGKDLLASHLVMLGYQVLSFVANLRNELERLAKTQAPPPAELLSLPPSSPARLGWLRMLSNPKSLWAKPTESPIRHLLQWYGTDYRRKSNPSHWVDSLASDYQLLQKLKPLFFPNHNQFHIPLIPVVIPDVRFENEAQWVTSNSGVLFLIDNPEAKSKYLLTHPEHSSDDLKPLLKYITHTFSNTQTQHHLAHQLLQYLFSTPDPQTYLLPIFHQKPLNPVQSPTPDPISPSKGTP